MDKKKDFDLPGNFKRKRHLPHEFISTKSPVKQLTPYDINVLKSSDTIDYSAPQYLLESSDFIKQLPDIYREIDLSANYFQSFEAPHFSKLRHLALDNCSLTNFNGSGLKSLISLSLSQNRLVQVPVLDDCLKLQNLDLSFNKISGSGFHNLVPLKELRVLDLTECRIEVSLPKFNEEILVHLKQIRLWYISFLENPIEKEIQDFRLMIINQFPELRCLDWDLVTKDERINAQNKGRVGHFQLQSQNLRDSPVKKNTPPKGKVLMVGPTNARGLSRVIDSKTVHSNSSTSKEEGDSASSKFTKKSPNADPARLSHFSLGRQRSNAKHQIKSEKVEVPERVEVPEKVEVPENIEIPEKLEITEKVVKEKISSPEKVEVPPFLQIPDFELPDERYSSEDDNRVLEWRLEPDPDPDSDEADLATVDPEVAQREAEIAKREAEIAKREADIAKDLAKHEPESDESESSENNLDLVEPEIEPEIEPDPKFEPKIEHKVEQDELDEFFEEFIADISKQTTSPQKKSVKNNKYNKYEVPIVPIPDISFKPKKDLYGASVEQKPIPTDTDALLEEIERTYATPLEEDIIDDPTIESKFEKSKVDPNVINMLEVQIKEPLKVGTYGTSFRAIWKEKVVVAKKISENFQDQTIVSNIQAEVLSFTKLKHPNIVTVLGSGVMDTTYILTSFIPDCTPADQLLIKSPVTNATVLHILRETLKGLTYLHSNGILHGSLRSHNILVDIKHRVFLTDFGLMDVKDYIPIELMFPQFMAPELVRGSVYADPADIYSFGMLLYHLTTHKIPYGEMIPSEIVEMLCSDNIAPLTLPFQGKLSDIFKKCTSIIPENRPSLADIERVLNEVNDFSPPSINSSPAKNTITINPIVTYKTPDSLPSGLTKDEEEKLITITKQLNDMLISDIPSSQIKAINNYINLMISDARAHFVSEKHQFSAAIVSIFRLVGQIGKFEIVEAVVNAIQFWVNYPSFRTLFMSNGVIDGMINFLYITDIYFTIMILKTFTKIAQFHPESKKFFVKERLIKYINMWIQQRQPDLLIPSLLFISELSSTSSNIPDLVSFGVFSTLFDMLNDPNANNKFISVSILSNFVCSQAIWKRLTSFNLLTKVFGMIDHPKLFESGYSSVCHMCFNYKYLTEEENHKVIDIVTKYVTDQLRLKSYSNISYSLYCLSFMINNLDYIASHIPLRLCIPLLKEMDTSILRSTLSLFVLLFREIRDYSSELSPDDLKCFINLMVFRDPVVRSSVLSIIFYLADLLTEDLLWLTMGNLNQLLYHTKLNTDCSGILNFLSLMSFKDPKYIANSGIIGTLSIKLPTLSTFTELIPKIVTIILEMSLSDTLLHQLKDPAIIRQMKVMGASAKLEIRDSIEQVVDRLSKAV